MYVPSSAPDLPDVNTALAGDRYVNLVRVTASISQQYGLTAHVAMTMIL